MKLYTASGQMFELALFIESKRDGVCYIHIVNCDLQTIVSTFSNPKETCVMTYGEQRLLGYKNLTKIEIEDGYIFITLQREYEG